MYMYLTYVRSKVHVHDVAVINSTQKSSHTEAKEIIHVFSLKFLKKYMVGEVGNKTCVLYLGYYTRKNI